MLSQEERGDLVVEPRTPEREFGGSRPYVLEKDIFPPPKSNGNTQEVMAPS